jgi:hypothetical protein
MQVVNHLMPNMHGSEISKGNYEYGVAENGLKDNLDVNMKEEFGIPHEGSKTNETYVTAFN